MWKINLKILLIFCILLSIISCVKDKDVVKNNNNSLNSSKISSRILIYGNDGWVSFRNVGGCTGSGNSSNPYIIQDLMIDGDGWGTCLEIIRSDVYFIIENCTLFNAAYSGLTMNIVRNGKVINNNCSNSVVNDAIGINLVNCQNVLVQGNNVNVNSEYGINLYESSHNEIKENIVNYNDFAGIYIDSNSNDNKIIRNTIGYSTYGIIIFTSCNMNWIEGNLIHNNVVGILIDYQAICNTIIFNNFVDNAFDQQGTQGICPFTIFITIISIIGISIIGIIAFTMIRRKRKSKIQVGQISLKPKPIIPTIEISDDSHLEEITKFPIHEIEELTVPFPEIQQELTSLDVQTTETQLSEMKEPASSESPIPMPQIKMEEDLEQDRILEKPIQAPTSEPLLLKAEEQKLEEISKPNVQELQPIPSEELAPLKLEQEIPTISINEKEPVKPKPLKNICPFCGFENVLEQKYCTQCGYKLKK